MIHRPIETRRARAVDLSRGIRPTRNAVKRGLPTQDELLEALAVEVAARWWFIAETVPNSELVTVRWLMDAGFAAFMPTRTEWRKRSRYARGKDAKVKRTYSVLPRYAFVGFEPRRPAFYAAQEAPHLLGFVGVGGEPRRVNPALVERVAALSSEAEAYKRFQISRAEFTTGDRVDFVAHDRTTDAQPRAIVKEIRDGDVLLLVEMLGGEREVWADASQLRKAI